MYLDYAEDQARRHKQIFMRDWRKKMDAFLKFNERDILKNAGKVTKEIADKLALKQEADTEILADEAKFKQIEEKIKKLPKKRNRH